MTFTKLLFVLFLINSFRNGMCGGTVNNKETDQNIKSVTNFNGSFYEKSLLGDYEGKDLKQEILKELNHLSFRKQREIFVDLEKQQAKFNVTQKSLVSSESETLSPLNVEELKNIQKTIKTSNSSLPAIRNKRTLNLLLNLVARAMGYSLTPSNTDAEWIPRQQSQLSAQPCSTLSSSTPPPCSMPPTTPPCLDPGAIMQSRTVPPNQINANTVSYTYRPARTIPLFNFAPLPAGIKVPYPPLLQPPAQRGHPCTSQQPSTPICNASAPSSPPCGVTPAPKLPQPCKPIPSTSPPPCDTIPVPSSAPRPSPCCSTPSPKPQSCPTNPPPPPPPSPCATPAPRPPPCATPAPRPPPCATPAPRSPPCTNPTPTPPPYTPPPGPPPCNFSSPRPSESSKKGSVVLEYDDPVRIEIFSNDKKYLPASGKVYSGDLDDQQQDWHSHFFPSDEKTENKGNDFEEEEMQEEQVEEEEEDEAPGHYEEEDERNSANSEDEEDESETNLSVVKKPLDQKVRKMQRQKSVSSKTKLMSTVGGERNEKEENIKNESKEKTQKIKKPKRKKWVRIVKKQRKTKKDSYPLHNFEVFTADSIPEGTRIYPKIYKETQSKRGNSHLHDISDFSKDSSRQSAENPLDFRKVIINEKHIYSPELEKAYEFSINPFTHSLRPQEEARREKLEKAVEKYVEDFVEKQLGKELIKNTGIPKTTVFEFAPQNGPKIQTITTTVAKTSHSRPVSGKAPTRPSASAGANYRNPTGNTHIGKQSNYEQTLKKLRNNHDTLTRNF